MKRVILVPVKSVTGKPFNLPDFDGVLDEQGNPIIVETTDLLNMLKLLIFNFPRPKLTMQDAIHGKRLYDQICQAKDGVLPIEEAEHDWIKKVLNDYGPLIFGVSAVQIKDALENFERPS